ncbi:hypothetical protein [Dictyobacter aurantiacus]|uniref:Uncharacterized protein n=1 Tax=Dictyobacter aurantiacus TaxID=1936993 RepID=A0A401Z7L8_9CHLR|nr:hypothetical protein [Dictyobacter aurantiacus]GCE02851.1 hypothetical protein KDAU_01800 [Dictyobacter aurantiacus]
MGVYMGIDCLPADWRICLAQDETPLEWKHFQDDGVLQTYLQQACFRYPDISIAVATSGENRFMSLAQWRDEPVMGEQICEDAASFLLPLSLQGHLLPSVQYLPTIAAHKRAMRPSLGSAASICHIAYLLYQMRMQDAPWLELTFYYLELLDNAYRLVVLQHGQLVDGSGEWKVLPVADCREVDSQKRKDVERQALLEQLTRELAAMMAIHHIEDIVVLDHTTQPAALRKEVIIDHFADRYRFFHYPQLETELADFEAAQGAALCAYGLSRPGLAAEVVRQLFATTNAEHLNDHRQ